MNEKLPRPIIRCEMGTSTMRNISSLPDYTALKKLASALWQQETSYHGAAVMVGAGFSRSAASTGDVTKKLPLWNHFEPPRVSWRPFRLSQAATA